MSGPKHILSIRELSGDEIRSIVEQAAAVKHHPGLHAESCAGKGLLLLFEKTSTRTLLSFSSAISQMGGYAVRLAWAESNFAISPIRYEARYVSRNCDAIMARLVHYDDLAELAAHSSVPVINGCCTRYHPSQALADLLTIHEVAGGFEGVTVTYVGILNNTANSLIAGCTRVGVKVNLVTPIVNEPARDDELLVEARATGLLAEYETLAEAAAGTDFVYTDTWIDMEHFDDPAYTEERDKRIQLMAPFQVSRANLGGATPYVMHDMPIHPGYEIDEEMVDDPKSVIFDQAENRMHVAKALLLHLLT